MQGTEWNAHISVSATANTTKPTVAAAAAANTTTYTPFNLISKMTPVKNQGSCGSCWSFAAVGIIESGLKVKYGKDYDLSEQEIVDCCSSTLNKNVCSVGGGCNGGNSEQALNYVALSGINTEAAYPYTAITGKCKNTTNTSTRSKVVNSTKAVTYVTANSDIALRTALNTTQKPVAVYVDASAWSTYKSGIFTGCNTTKITLNHAVVAVGYDARGNWIVRNSWGPTMWSVDGYITLAVANTTSGPCGILSNPFYTLTI